MLDRALALSLDCSVRTIDALDVLVGLGAEQILERGDAGVTLELRQPVDRFDAHRLRRIGFRGGRNQARGFGVTAARAEHEHRALSKALGALVLLVEHAANDRQRLRRIHLRQRAHRLGAHRHLVAVARVGAGLCELGDAIRRLDGRRGRQAPS